MTQNNERALALVDDYILTYTEMNFTSTVPHAILGGFVRDLESIRTELLPKPSIFEEDLQKHQDMLARARKTCAYCGEAFLTTETTHILGGPVPTYYHTGDCFTSVLKEIDDNREKEKTHEKD